MYEKIDETTFSKTVTAETKTIYTLDDLLQRAANIQSDIDWETKTSSDKVATLQTQLVDVNNLIAQAQKLGVKTSEEIALAAS